MSAEVAPPNREPAGIPCADLVARADRGLWSNHEHRADPPALAPRLGWAMGSAGIARELLRYARLRAGGDPDYAVAWPDQPPVIGCPRP